MYHIAICDDNLQFADYVEKLFIDGVGINQNNALFYKYDSGEELIDDFDKNIPFNLLILDMQMKELDGDDTAHEFRKKYPDVVLVFCSGISQPTVRSFEANAYRYILKEYDSDRMIQELIAIMTEVKRKESEPILPINYRNETVLIRTSDILYVSIRKHGSSVYVLDKPANKTRCIVCNKTIDQLFCLLDRISFSYAHNSYFVNLRHIINLGNSQVELVDGTVLTVSRSRERNFKEDLSRCLAEKY